MRSRLGSMISETETETQRRMPDRAGRQDRTEQSGRSGQAVRSRQNGRFEQQGRRERYERSGQAAAGTRQYGRPGQAAGNRGPGREQATGSYGGQPQSGRGNRTGGRANGNRSRSSVSPEVLERRRRAQAARLERERRKKRRQQIKFIFSLGTAVLVILVLTQGIAFLGKKLRPDRGNEKTPASTASAQTQEGVEGTAEGSRDAVFAASGNILDDKKILTDSFLEAALKEMAGGDSVLAEIFTARAQYPEELLEALVNNLELKDFVHGFLTADGSVTGGFMEEEKEQDFPLFLQWDARWGYAPYGESNIGISGCGPTCLSMVIFALTRDETATPDKLADYSMENNHYVPGIGTAWLLMSEAASDFGIKASEVGLDGDEMRRQLDMGRPIICAMRPGDFTTTGHFIVIYGYDENGFKVNDPNSRERSGRRWTFDELRYQIKNLWCYRK